MRLLLTAETCSRKGYIGLATVRVSICIPLRQNWMFQFKITKFICFYWRLHKLSPQVTIESYTN